MKKLLIFLMFLISSVCAEADTWRFDKELVEEDYKFGELEIRTIRDTRSNQAYPEFRVVVLRKNKEIANFKNLTFEKAATFGKDNYFLGVSNSGLSTFAFIILDKSGGLLRAENHSNSVKYCRMSSTLVREWVNLDNLDIKEEYETIENEFDPEDPYVFLKSVTVNGCSGERVEVWDLGV